MNSLRLFLACVYRQWDVAEELVEVLEAHLRTDLMRTRKQLLLLYMGITCFVLGVKEVVGVKASVIKKRIRFRLLGKKILGMLKDDLKQKSVNTLHVILMLEAFESPSKEKFDEAIRATGRLGWYSIVQLCANTQEFTSWIEKMKAGESITSPKRILLTWTGVLLAKLVI